MSRFDEEPDGDPHGECALEIASLQSENASLREELELIRAALTGDDYASLPSDLPTVRMAHTVRADHDKFRNQVRDTCHRAEQAEKELAEAKRDTGLAKLVIQQKQDQIASAEAALEQAEARALEYKTEHAALIGTSQWQETEIADLRDDVKRHMQIASECEERALANEKDAAVAKFGATCFAEHRDEMSDLDGGWLHEKALECGLIYGKEVTAEMWDGCGSVHCECEVGDICYFPTDAGKAAISGAKHEG